MPRVLVTQPEGSSKLADALRSQGLDVWHVPTIAIEPISDWSEADAELREWTTFDWIVVTSAAVVPLVAERLLALGIEVGASPPLIAAVGDATGDALAQAGWEVDCMPETFGGEALAAELQGLTSLAGARVLFPKSRKARAVLPNALREACANVTEVAMYDTVPAAFDGTSVRETMVGGRIDAVAFASPSAARSFVSGVGAGIWDAAPASLVVACIGPTTSAAVREAGREPDCEPATASVEALASSIGHALQKETLR